MMEEKSISFNLYKLTIICLKYIPFLIGTLSLIDSILGCIGITSIFFSIVGQGSILGTMFWILASFTFKCCIWHRLPIYYCGINNIVSGVDYKGIIPVNNLQMILIYSVIALIFIITGMYFKNKYNKSHKTRKPEQ